MKNLKELLPNHLKHLQHSKLFKSLETAVSTFQQNKIVDEVFLKLLVRTLATEFEKMFDRPPVNARVVEIADNSSIVNYRFDRGYWEIVIHDTSVMVSDKSTSTTIFFSDAQDVSVEGSGSSLRKGKRKSESIQRAHTRQVAKDARYQDTDSDADEGESEWEP